MRNLIKYINLLIKPKDNPNLAVDDELMNALSLNDIMIV
jgi:hypothetical protein